MKKMILLAGIPAMALAGCQGVEQGVPLVFARTQTVGISVAGSVPDQGAHLTLGFADRNIAIVPTTQSNGNPIRSRATESDQPFEDSLSVLGQFQASAEGGAGVSAGLGTFFSTGLAARNLAEGFACGMGLDCPAAETAPGNSAAGNSIGPN